MLLLCPGFFCSFWIAMSKKGKKSGEGEGKWDTEDVFQAVVIADSFNFRFLPITIERPRALLPLVNRPLIDYTVEFLAVAGIQEIFVFCCAHADMIRAHLEGSRWMKPTSPVKLQIIISEDCPSVGDALRDIDSQSLIRSDFVLVSGDLVANMELMEVIQKHKEIRKKDKMSVMTCVYKMANPNHPTRSSEDDILIATNSVDGRLLHCEKPKSRTKKFNIPVSIFEENPDVEVRYDVLDCHISVCAPSVPQLFSDNFDYQSRHHFIRGIIVDEEITGNHIYTHFISDKYAARVSNLRTYDAVSKDVIHRWVYPLVPDNVIGESYSYGRHNIYLNTDITLAMGAVLQEDVVIGKGSKIGANTKISHSSIGHNCVIGENVVIEGSYIWDSVEIEEGCRIHRSIVCDGAKVKCNVTLEEGCILSYGVMIGPDFTLKQGARLTTKQRSNSSESEWGEDDEERGEGDTDKELPKDEPLKSLAAYEPCAGHEGVGFLWHPPSNDEEDDSDQNNLEKWPPEENTISSEESSVSSHESSLEPLEGETDTIMFYNEILDSIRSGLAELTPNDNTILMINASKHAYNIPIQDVPLTIVKAIVEGPLNTTTPSSSSSQASDLLTYIKNAISHFESLLQHYIKGHEVQVSVMQTLGDCACKHQSLLTVFPKIVLLLYNADIIEEAAVLEWHSRLQGAESPSGGGGSGLSGSKKQDLISSIQPVIEWLENAEEETSDEEESGEED